LAAASVTVSVGNKRGDPGGIASANEANSAAWGSADSTSNTLDEVDDGDEDEISPRERLLRALDTLEELAEAGDGLLLHVPEHALLRMEIKARRLGLKAQDALRGGRSWSVQGLERLVGDFESARGEGAGSASSDKAALAAGALGGTRVAFAPGRAALEGEVRSLVGAALAWRQRVGRLL